ALEIGDLGGLGLFFLNVIRTELNARAKIGVHRALAIRRHEDHAARRWRKTFKCRSVESHAQRTDVMAKHVAERVISHLAEMGCLAAKTGKTSGRIACAASGGLNRWSHLLVEIGSALRIDEIQRALDDVVLDQKRLFAAGNDIDNGVADAEDVVFAHEGLRSKRWA